MQVSESQFRRSLLTIGESLELLEETKTLLETEGLYHTARELSFMLFVKERNEYFEKDESVYNAIHLVRQYFKEFLDKGEVVFDQPYRYIQPSKKRI